MASAAARVLMAMAATQPPATIHVNDHRNHLLTSVHNLPQLRHHSSKRYPIRIRAQATVRNSAETISRQSVGLTVHEDANTADFCRRSQSSHLGVACLKSLLLVLESPCLRPVFLLYVGIAGNGRVDASNASHHPLVLPRLRRL